MRPYCWSTKVGIEDDVEVAVNDGCIKQKGRSSCYVWQYFTVQIHQKLKKVVRRFQPANFVTTFNGCRTARATAHILGRPAVGQIEAGTQTCIAIDQAGGPPVAPQPLSRPARSALPHPQRGLSRPRRWARSPDPDPDPDRLRPDPPPWLRNGVVRALPAPVPDRARAAAPRRTGLESCWSPKRTR